MEGKLMICPRAKGCKLLNCLTHRTPHTHNYSCKSSSPDCPKCVPYVPTPRKGIHIIGRQVVKDGVKGRIIDKIEGMKNLKELPIEYIHNGFPNCYEVEGTYSLWNEAIGTDYNIEIGDFLPEETYQKYLKLIREAGKNLSRINKELKAKKQAEETKETKFEEWI
jgi:hypothetical protein